LFDAELSSTTRGRERREELTIGGSDDASTIVRDLSDFDLICLLLPAAVRAGDPRPPQIK
jgi:hypothetical protein